MHKVLLLSGDGIGPEIMEQAKKVLHHFKDLLTYEEGVIGGVAIEKLGNPFPEVTLYQFE